jgi:flagellar biogenesis protein FliO
MQVSIAVQEILFLLILILFILGLTYFFYKFFSKKKSR